MPVFGVCRRPAGVLRGPWMPRPRVPLGLWTMMIVATFLSGRGTASARGDCDRPGTCDASLCVQKTDTRGCGALDLGCITAKAIQNAAYSAEYSACLAGRDACERSRALLRQECEAARTRSVDLSIAVDTRYDDSPASLEQLNTLVASLPPYRVEVKPGDSISTLIFRHYRFGTSDGLPRTYQLAHRAIEQLNGLAPGATLYPGSILIPAIPPRARPMGNDALARFETPREFRIASSVAMARAPGGLRVLSLDLSESAPATSMSIAEAPAYTIGGGCPETFTYPEYVPRHCAGACGVFDLGCVAAKAACEAQRVFDRANYDARRAAAEAAWSLAKQKCEAERQEALGLPMMTTTVQATTPPLEPAGGAAVVRLTLENVPSRLAEQLVLSERSGGRDVEVLSGSLDVLLESCDREPTENEPPEAVLSPAESNALDALLSAPVRRSVTLYILDTSWPSRDAQEHSLNALRERFAAYRARLGMTAKLLGTYPFQPSVQFHARVIERSLREFNNRAVPDQIRIVYLPLIMDQPGSVEVTRELLLLHYYRQLAVSEPRLASSVREAKAFTRAANTIAALPQPPAVPVKVLRTDRAVLDAVMSMEDLLSASATSPFSGSSFFMNLSWTLPVDLLDGLGVRPSATGALVSAAGNTNLDVNGNPPIDFAARSLHDPHYITVMNMKDGPVPTPTCFTSKVPEDPALLAQNRTVGYNGQVTVDCCGTSFAAPRVAWLLAVAEAYREEDVIRAGWLTRHDRLLKHLRRAEHPGHGSLFLNCPALLSASSMALMK